jgi:hypothetical protein
MNKDIHVEPVHAGFISPELPAPPVLRRVDGRGQRFYYTATKDGSITIYPSVTSIIRTQMPMAPGLLRWWTDLGYDRAKEILSQKAHYGTLYHILCSKLLQAGTFELARTADFIATYVAENNVDFDISDWEYELKRDLLSFAQFCAEKQVKVLAVEVPLLSERLGFAGTLDLVCEMTFNRKTVTAIVDIKSGKGGLYEEYEVQLEAYRQLWNDQVPTHQATMLFNFSPKDWRKEPTYELKNQTESQNAFKWPLFLEMYKPITTTDGVIVLGRDLDGLYSVVEIEEHLAQLHAGSRATEVLEAADVETY